MKAARMEFTTSHLHWTPEDCCKVSYTDKSTFRLVRRGTCYVRRGKGANRSEQKFYRPTVKHSASIMIWGMFDGRYSRWDISFVPRRGKNRKTMDTKKYITTVKNHFLRRRRVRGSTHLLQDSAPCHKSNASKKWIREHGIEVINSPSLNPIENLWSIFKGKLYTTKQRSPPPLPWLFGKN